MSRHHAIAALTLLTSACVIEAEHVKTRLVQVCTEELPLVFERQSSGLSVATVEVDGIGATVDHPDARTSLRTMTIEVLSGADDFAFADSLTLDFVAPASGLPPARAAEAMSEQGASPWTVPGDSGLDLVDYLTAETLEMRLTLSGEMPAGPVVTLFGACLDVDGIVIADR